MANLSWFEKRNLEKLFGMASGYVLDFSNRTFEEFIADCTGRNIFDPKYAYGSGSKANCLRGFWTEEPNHLVGKALLGLLEYYLTIHPVEENSELFVQCRRIADRLVQDAPIPDAEVISVVAAEKDFEAVAKAVRDTIEKNEPEKGLDRLHTFAIKYVRHLCVKHGIAVDRDKPLHSLFGEYVKRLKREGRLESEMTERILKSSISTLDAFNDVRNNKSLAHDNPVLNYNESLLIFSHLSASIRFISTIEKSAITADGRAPREAVSLSVSDEIPF